MSKFVSKLFRKSGLMALSSILIFSAIFAMVVTITQAPLASAHCVDENDQQMECPPPDPNPDPTPPKTPQTPSCPSQKTDQDTNIIYNGLGSESASPETLRASLESYFSGSKKGDAGNCYSDAPAIFSHLGLTQGMLDDKNGWAKGTTHTDGTITIDGSSDVVATNGQVTSRCFSGMWNCQPTSKYAKLLSSSSSNVYTHDTSWFTDASKGSVKTLIYRDNDGNALFAIWIHCGNAMHITPKPPVQELVCKQLEAKPGDQDEASINFNFTVTAEVTNVKNITYTIDYGDNSTPDSKSVTNGASTVNFSHKYTKLEEDKIYTASAQVNHQQPQVKPCQSDIHVPGKKKLSFACVQLEGVPISHGNGNVTYKFTADVSGTDKPGTYQFFTSDNGQSTEQTSNTFTHQFNFDTSKSQTFSTYFIAKSATGLKTDQNDKNCMKSFPTELTETGPASTFGIFAAASTGGVLLHQFIVRRKLSA